MGYKNIKITKFEGGIKNASNGKFIAIEQALNEIKDGTYSAKIKFLRVFKQSDQAEDKKAYNIEKSKLDYYCFMCRCSYRNAKSVTAEDTTPFFIADIDNLDDIQLGTIKDKLKKDQNVFAVFESPSGEGLKVLYLYDNKDNSVIDAFYAVQDKIYRSCNIKIDPSGKDIVRACYTSFDPDIYINYNATPIKIISRVIDNYENVTIAKVSDTSLSEFKKCVDFICSNGINIVEDYKDWVYVGLIIASNYGESGREYFHELSSISPKYNYSDCEKKYNNLIKTNRGSLNVSWIFGKAGYESYGESKHFVIAEYLRNIGIYYNEITNRYEWPNGKQFTDRDECTQFLKLSENGIKKVSMAMFRVVLGSNFVDTKNPLMDLYNRLVDDFKEEYMELVDEYLNHYNFEIDDSNDPDKFKKWILRWMLQFPASIQGFVPELCLVLLGKQNNGKTELFNRKLLPEMKPYYSTDKLDSGDKDADIALAENICILDDEFSGKSKKESAHWKSVLSKRTIKVRRPYGRNVESLSRLAIFCGTSNEYDIIYDRTGNRRVLPIPVESRDFEVFDGIDKYKLWSAIFGYWHMNRDSHKLTTDELNTLWDESDNYTVSNQERDLLIQYYDQGNENINDGDWYTSAEIASFLTKETGLRIHPIPLGKECKRLGWEKKNMPSPRRGSKGYYLKQKVYQSQTFDL